MNTATCIGCGCNDFYACLSESTSEPCRWLSVDYCVGRGVCSECPEDLQRWNTGDRRILARMLVAKIIREGETDPYFREIADMASFTDHSHDAKAGDRYLIELVDMSVDEFENLPQFEFVRL